MSKSEEYTYKLPADYTLKPETKEKLDKLVHQLGLSNEQAQEFVDIHIELMEEYAATIFNKEAKYAPEEADAPLSRKEKYGRKTQ